MRTLEWMQDNYKNLPIETSWQKMEEKFYRGRQCKKGHLPVRYVRGNTCCECQRLKSIANNKATEKTIKSAYQGKPLIKNLNNIITGILYIVLGHAESGSS